MVDNIANPTPAQRPALTEAQKNILRDIQRNAVRNGRLDTNQAQRILLQNIDQFVGNNNMMIDGSAEVLFLRDLINGTGGDEFISVQNLLSENLDRLSILRRDPETFENDVNRRANDFSPNYDNIAGPRLDGGANSARRIDENMARWRQDNAGNTFNVPGSNALNAANEALRTSTIPQDRLNGLTDNQAKLRKILHSFWNNDANGVKFLSLTELEALRQWGMEAYGGNMEAFQKDLNEMFVKSVKEDTSFSMELMAMQWSQAKGSSAFFGEGREGYSKMFDSLGEAIANDVIKTKGLKKGDTVTAYNGQKENPGFDNVVIKVGEDGKAKIEVSKSQYGDVKKIGYIFDKSSRAGAPPAGGGFGAGGVQAPGQAAPPANVNRDLKDIDKNIGEVKNELDVHQNDPNNPDLQAQINKLNDISARISALIRTPASRSEEALRKLADELRAVADEIVQSSGGALRPQANRLNEQARRLEVMADGMRTTTPPPSGTPPSGTPPSGTPPSGTPPSGKPDLSGNRGIDDIVVDLLKNDQTLKQKLENLVDGEMIEIEDPQGGAVKLKFARFGDNIVWDGNDNGVFHSIYSNDNKGYKIENGKLVVMEE